MRTTTDWIEHFRANALREGINWERGATLSPAELAVILPSLQVWQLGETSEGTHFLKAAAKYAEKVGDPAFLEAAREFLKEEQKHGINLGKYLDAIGQPRIRQNWGDTLFRKVRHFATSMEVWTVTVIVVDSTAQIFYNALRDATRCDLLRDVCTDIIIDEAYHIFFQTERLSAIFASKTELGRSVRRRAYAIFYYITVAVVWMAHREFFRASRITFASYMAKMEGKYLRTIGRVTTSDVPAVSLAGAV